MSYEIYKIIHVYAVVSFISTMGIALYGTNSKYLKISSGITTLLILVSGMGLLARLGIGHGGMWPGWVLWKVAIWLVLGISLPVVAKRLPQFGKHAFAISLIVLAAVVAIVQYKP